MSANMDEDIDSKLTVEAQPGPTDIYSQQWILPSVTPRSRLSSIRSSTKVCPYICARARVTETDLDGVLEYKIWKKNAPFLYDLILRFVFTLHLPLITPANFL